MTESTDTAGSPAYREWVEGTGDDPAFREWAERTADAPREVPTADAPSEISFVDGNPAAADAPKALTLEEQRRALVRAERIRPMGQAIAGARDGLERLYEANGHPRLGTGSLPRFYNNGRPFDEQVMEALNRLGVLDSGWAGDATNFITYDFSEGEEDDDDGWMLDFSDWGAIPALMAAAGLFGVMVAMWSLYGAVVAVQALLALL